MGDSDNENGAPGTSSGGGSGGSTKTVPIGAGAADLSAILREIRESQRKLDTKFAKFQDEIKQGQEDAAAKALKRVRREKPYAYKRKGNEEQASFNEKVGGCNSSSANGAGESDGDWSSWESHEEH